MAALPHYTLRTVPDGLTRATFEVPASLAPLVAATPISTNGGTFELRLLGVKDDDKDDGDGCARSTAEVGSKEMEGNEECGTATIYVEFYSPRPTDTADAIAVRLARRLEDPSPPIRTEDACMVS